MLNHIHLIAKADDMIGVIRDFKTFTSKEIRKNIAATEPNILKLFKENGSYEFWQKTNMPELIISEEFYLSKAKYIIENPARKGYVRRPEDWVYSSANKDECSLKLESIYG